MSEERQTHRSGRKNITLSSYANYSGRPDVIKTKDGSRVVKLVEEYINYIYGPDFWYYYMGFYRAQTERAQEMIQNYTIYNFEGPRNSDRLEWLNYVIDSTRGIRQPMIVYRNFTGLDEYRSISLNGRVPASASLKRTQCEHIPNTDCIVIYLPENSKILPLFMYYQFSMNDNYNYKPMHIEVLIESKGILVRTPYITPYNVMYQGDGGYPIFYYSQDGNENLEHIPNLKEKIDNWLTYESLEPTPYPYSIGYTLREQQANEEMKATRWREISLREDARGAMEREAMDARERQARQAREEREATLNEVKQARKRQAREENLKEAEEAREAKQARERQAREAMEAREIMSKQSAMDTDDIEWQDGGKRRKLKLKKNRKKITRRRKPKKRTIRKRTTRR